MPPDATASFIGGSVARGWQHARSDADVYVVLSQPWTGPANGMNTVALSPGVVPTQITHLDDRRWELRYWTEGQVSQLFEKTGWDVFSADDPTGRRITPYEVAFLCRLATALPISGVSWLHEAGQRLKASAFRAILTVRALNDADAAVEDALGMVESGDLGSAVLAARTAFGAAVDALTLHHGEYGLEAKWQDRRVRATQPALLPIGVYRDFITLRSLDPRSPTDWIMSVLEWCRRVALEVEVTA
ncbi:hypothetical protein BG844_18585 [Couchioplanes caeruleus subsp. caeruleus]|uniref:Polymerase nucleotidyl transferase domain-containing protein n=1 Tax=Couchioplanes caeruleus subsp. caeruleus TaxID=56427 RepID=A0A1K0FIY9_9ACTN|nr:hypothetical protein BG844_18585 [Couchioplanes caeruleus subsp. caeruleus]